MKNSDKVYTPADKTSNIYKISKEEHNQLLSNAVTSTYKKANEKLAEKINKLGKKFAEKRKNLSWRFVWTSCVSSYEI